MSPLVLRGELSRHLEFSESTPARSNSANGPDQVVNRISLATCAWGSNTPAACRDQCLLRRLTLGSWRLWRPSGHGTKRPFDAAPHETAVETNRHPEDDALKCIALEGVMFGDQAFRLIRFELRREPSSRCHLAPPVSSRHANGVSVKLGAGKVSGRKQEAALE